MVTHAAIEEKPIVETQLRLTRVVTVPTGLGSNEHRTFPNMVYNGAPAGNLDLRIEAEAGEDVFTANPAYQLSVGITCLDDPLVNLLMLFPAFSFAPGPIPVENVGGWALDPLTGSYKKAWTFTLQPAGGFIALHKNHTYQCVVSLIDTGAAQTIASTMLSEPFVVI